jgi:hypothetical protein
MTPTHFSAPTLVGSTIQTANASKQPLAGPIAPPRSESVFSADAIQLQRRMRFNPLRMLDPENLSIALDQFDIGILRQAALLWDAMVRRDDTLSFVKPQLENAIAGKPWGVFKKAGADEVEAARHAAALEYFYNNVTAVNAFDRNEKGGRHKLLKQMGECFAYKYAVHHIVWESKAGTPEPMIEVEGGAPVPKLTATLEYVPLWFFENVSGTLRFLPFGGFGIDGQELNWDGEWICTTGQGIMFAAAICYVFKRLTFQDWTIFNERYAQQKPLGMTNAKKDDEAGRSMADIIASFNSDMGIVLYECQNTDKPPVQLLGPSGTVSVDLFERFLDRQDRKMTVMFRGSDLRNMSREKDTTGVSAQSDETEALEIAHCANISDSCREIDRQVIRFCFGEGVEPLAYFGLPDMDEEDAKEVRENAGFLADRGAKVDLLATAKRLGVTLTEDEENVLRAIGGGGATPEDTRTNRDGLDNATANARNLHRLQQLVEESIHQSGPDRTANSFDPNEERDENGRWTNGEVVLPDTPWEGEFAEKREKARAIVRQLKPVINEHTGKEIHFTRNTAKKTFHGYHTDHEFQSAQGLRKIMQHAQLDDSKEDYEEKQHLIAWHKFSTPVRVGDAAYRAEITVRETANGPTSFHAVHLHRLKPR